MLLPPVVAAAEKVRLSPQAATMMEGAMAMIAHVSVAAVVTVGKVCVWARKQ